MIRSKWMLVLVGLLAAVGCGQNRTDPTSGKVTPEDVQRDVTRAEQTKEAYAEQTKDEYQQQLDTRLKELDAEIAKLQEKSRDLKDEAKADWERQLPLLQAKRKTANDKLAEIRQSSAEAWKDLKKSTQSAWDDLDASLRDAARKYADR